MRDRWCVRRWTRAARPAAARRPAGPSSLAAGSGPRPRGTGSGARRRWTCPARRRTPSPRTPRPPDTLRRPAADRTRATRRPADQRVRGVHRRPPRRGLHHLAGGVVLDRFRARARPVRRRGRRLPRAGAGPGWRSSWDQLCHRPPTVEAPEIPLFHRGLRNFLQKLFGPVERGRVRARAAVVSTSSTSGWASPAWRALALTRRAGTQATAEPQPARRRQPDTQPAFGPRRGCQPAPEPSEGTQD